MQAQNYQFLGPEILLWSHGQSSLHQVVGTALHPVHRIRPQYQHFSCAAGTLTFQEQEKLGWMVDMIARSSAQAQVNRTMYSGVTDAPACRITFTSC